VRNATAGVLIAALSLLTISTLTACTPSASAASCAGGLPSSDIAKTVSVTGDQDALPATAAFPTPLVASETTANVLTQGDGKLVEPGDVVTGTFTIFDGASGQAMTGGQLTLSTTAGDLPLATGAVCARVGSRVAVVGPASELLADYTSQVGIQDTDTVVVAIDIDGAYLGRAEGRSVLPQNGLPTVSLAPDGRPGVSFTGAAAPSDLRIETLIQGGGATVQDGDQVVLQYTGIDYETHKVFDSTWQDGRPTILGTGDVVPGFKQAIVGASVGSQVLAVVPPADGYGDSTSSPVAAGDSMVFVIDILGIAPAAAASAK